MAIITQAAQDVMLPRTATLRREALEFFNDPLYESICMWIDVDPEAVRERLLPYMEVPNA